MDSSSMHKKQAKKYESQRFFLLLNFGLFSFADEKSIIKFWRHGYGDLSEIVNDRKIVLRSMNFCFLVLCFHERNFFRDFRARTLKMVWNIQYSALEKNSGWMCVRACVKTSKNLNICISGITQLIELKFDIEVKPKCLFLPYNFCRNWLTHWDFITFRVFEKCL